MKDFKVLNVVNDTRDIDSKNIKFLSRRVSYNFDNAEYVRPYHYPKDYDTYDKNKIMHLRELSIMTTEDCNLRCTYCYIHNKKKKSVCIDDAKKIIDIITGTINDDKFGRFILISPFILNIMGGEPLMESEKMYDIIKYFDKRIKDNNIGIYWDIWIPSNGILVKNNKYVDKIIDEFGNKLRLDISIDGCKECHDSCRVFPNGSGSYDASFEGFDILRKKYNSEYYTTKFTAAPKNIKYIYKSVKDYIDNGIKYFFINWVQDDKFTIDDAREYYFQCKKSIDYVIDNKLYNEYIFSVTSRESDSPKPRWLDDCSCEGSGYMVTLSPEGNILPCSRYCGQPCKKTGEELIFGDINNGIYTNKKYVYNKSKISIKRSESSTYKCYNCPCSTYCGYCQAYAYEIEGFENTRNTLGCPIQLADNLARAYGINKIYRELEKEDPKYFFMTYLVLCPEEWAVPIIGQEEYDMIIELSRERV